MTINPAINHVPLNTPRQFTLAIMESVGARHGVSAEEILGPRRTKRIVTARHEAIVEVVEARPHWSYPTVALMFGGRDHTTIMHALQKLGKWKPRERWADHPGGLVVARIIGTFIQSLTILDDVCASWTASEL